MAPDLPDLHNLPGVGINASHDATNRLAVAAAATLLSHEGGGHRLMVNKAASAETASLLFQTAASGRAEMGTTGTDAFAIKASPDGAAWHTGFEMRPSDGRVTLPGGLKVQGSLALDGVAGTLGSLGGLAGTADTMPYWTGAGTMDATGLTGAARQLLASDRIGVAGNTLTTPANARLTGGVVQSSLTDTTTGRAMLVGAFGWGSGTSNINALTTENALDDLRGGRMDRVQTANVATVNGPPGAQGGTALTMSYSAGNVVQMYVEVVGAGRAWFRHLNAGTWSVYRQLLTSGNTTVDGNGFIKAASPIVRLFADRIEEPVQPTGAVLTRTGVGTYALAGTLGLAQDGWQIEVPRDHNGNRLCHVATRWARGVLTVTVTDPVWRNGTWVAGAPADVPEGRWIDIRLHEAPEAARNGEAGG